MQIPYFYIADNEKLYFQTDKKEKRFKMKMRMDRKKVSFASSEEHDAREKDYWARASFEEKARTISYLRECFYGAEATTGRLQRVFGFSKLK